MNVPTRIDVDGAEAAAYLPVAKRFLARLRAALPLGGARYYEFGSIKMHLWWTQAINKVRITAAVADPWPFFIGSPFEALLVQSYSGSLSTFDPWDAAIAWDDGFTPGDSFDEPFDTSSHQPTTVEQGLVLVRAVYREGYPQAALALFKSLLFGVHRHLAGDSLSNTQTTVASTLLDFYEPTITVQAQTVTGLTVLEDDTVILMAPAPNATKGLGVYHVVTDGGADLGGIDLTGENIDEFAMALFVVNPDSTQGFFDLFSSARLVDLRQAVSSLVTPVEVGTPRAVTNFENSEPPGLRRTAVVQFNENGPPPTFEFISRRSEMLSCHSYTTLRGTRALWYVRTTHLQDDGGTWTTSYDIAAFAVELRPASGTAMEIVHSHSLAKVLEYTQETLQVSPFTTTYTPVSNPATPYAGRRGIEYAVSQLFAPTHGPASSGSVEETISYSYAGGLVVDPANPGLIGVTITGERFAASSVSTGLGGDDTTNKLWVDDVEEHSFVGPNVLFTSFPGVYQGNSTPSFQGTMTQQGFNGPPVFQTFGSSGTFVGGVVPFARHEFYAFPMLPYPWGTLEQRELVLPLPYYGLTVVRTDAPNAYLVLKVDDIQDFGWSARLTKLPTYGGISEWPANFNSLFGYQQPAQIYSAQGSNLSDEGPFAALFVAYDDFLTMPTGTSEEVIARIAAWDALRASAGEYFGDYHEVVWSEGLDSLTAEQLDTLVKIASATGPSDTDGLAHMVAFPPDDPEFEDAYP